MLRLLLVLAAVVFARPAPAQPVPQIKAGAFAQDVTPNKFPVSVNGGFSDRKATSAADPLHARCLVLDDGSTKLALVVVDSCMLPRELIDAAKELASKKTGIPASNVLISATHTHTAPTATGVFQSDPDEEYVAFLTAKIAEGIEKAHARLAPAKVGWGVAELPGQVFNRRWKMKPGVLNKDPFGGTTDKVRMNPGVQNPDLLEPAGPTDPAVGVLSVRDASDKPLSLLANYSLHYVGGVPALSADYFGAFGGLIGPKLGAGKDFVGILSNGTSGDVNNINFREPAPKRMPGEQARLVAEAVADAAKKATDGTTHHRFVMLRAVEKELELGVRKPTADEVKRAQGILDGVKGRELRGADEVYARETVLIAKYPDSVKLKVQVLKVGDLGVVAVPCEVFTDIGLSIKAKRGPFKTSFVVSLANGYNGYLPTPAHHALGGYETWRARSSYLEVQASEKIEAAVSELFGRIAAGK